MASRKRIRRVVLITVSTVVVLLAAGCVTLILYWWGRWAGDVPAVVEWVDPAGRWYTVTFSDYLPEDALLRDPGLSVAFTSVKPSFGPGDRVLCQVEQFYVPMLEGTQTEITHCRR